MAVWAPIDSLEMTTAQRWDAEFYVNQYNEYLNEIFSRRTDWVSVADASNKLTSGHTPLRHDVSEGDTPFITVECVNALDIDLDKAKRVWAHHANGELARVCVKRNDILITIKRRIAISCPVLREPGLMVANQDVVVMTPKKGLRPAYIAAVLNSRIGQFQALRHATEQMNPYINVTALGGLMIPKVSDRVQKVIEGVVIERLKAMDVSVTAYRNAESELLDRLGWEKLQQRPAELSYAQDFATLAATGRADAEFFQPQYARLRVQLNKRGAKPIGAFCSKVCRGVQPELIEGGEVVVVDSKAVRPIGVEPAASERTSRFFWSLPQNSKARIQDGDVLLNSTGRGTLGRASYYRLKDPGLCDNHVAILRPKAKVCHPVYLALFLNSPAGLAQSEQFQTGSSGQLEIYPQHIAQFLVFLPQQANGKVDFAWQERLAAKVEAAAHAKTAARAKLEEAKRLVEEAIVSRGNR